MRSFAVYFAAGLTAALAATLPFSAGAQAVKNRNAAPAARAAPAAHAPAIRPHVSAGRPAMPRPAFHPQAARAPTPHPQIRMARPGPVQRHVAPRFSTRHQATPQISQRRAFTRMAPRVHPRHATVQVTPHHRSAADRSVRRRLHATRTVGVNSSVQQRSHERRLRRQAVHANSRIERNGMTTGTVTRRQAATTGAGVTGTVTAHGTRLHRIDPQLARQGRFSAPFARADARRSWRHWRDPDRWLTARHAWRHHHRAHFVAWYGPIFWPYAYVDIFDYTFWPYGYEDGYWAYIYDDFFDSVFWGDYGPPEVYASAGPSGSYPRLAAPRAREMTVAELCQEPGAGITAWPFADIERKVGLSADQRQLLDDLREAAREAASAFKSSCPAAGAFPLTPPGRLAAMTARLEATLKAVEIVRPPLEKFYNALSDEQKERFNEIGPGKRINAEARAALPDQAKACAQAKPGLTNLPIERIEDVVNPTDDQRAALDRLGEATVKAVSILQAACPDETPLTPTGRLQAMEKRLKAMIDAANTVREPLDKFYASLNNEQKARFNRMGRALAQTQTDE